MGAYYYASGRRIELDRDDEYVAIDRSAAKRAGLDEQLPPDAKAAGATVSVVVAPRSELDAQTLASLRQAGAIQSVYRRDRAVMVPLPEVRAEFDSAEQRTAVLRVLDEGDLPPHTIKENSDERIVIAPASGLGDDALKIANEIYERASPAAASPRFIQIVPKPTVRR
jgi:hypothetical protein